MSSVAPGWYTDAENAALIRWWDGESWTDHTQPNPAAPAPDASAFPPPVSAATTAESTPASSIPMPAPSAPVPPPFAEPAATDLTVPPAADAVPSRRDTRASGSPSIPVSAPVKLVPPTSSSFPISEPVRLVPPTSPVAESAPSGWPAPDPAAPSVASTAPPEPSWASAEPTRAPDSGSFAVTPLATVPPAPASAGTPWTSSSTFAQPTGSVDLASVDYEPMTRTWGSARGSSASRTVTGVTTGGAWMLALSPLVQLGLLALGWVLTDGGTNSSTMIIGASFGAVLIAWVLVGAIADFRRLGALGHEFRPSVLWILVGPLMYLIARAIHVLRTTGKGVAPTWVYLALSIVVGAAAGAASLALPRDASLAELRQVEQSIAADLQQQGLDVSVICPSEATLAVGSTFVCTASDEVGPVALLRVTYGGVPGSFTFEVESSSTGS
ncbi:DUF2510 domain-containing protein [Microcella sp.]|uniref:DUF2510 domain-containing protein n=1 Tax=Microcella sp. TaxID=1913979 RepID=UPI00255DFE7A|nr:DUF2510 domain-containing protein [Microcella sp.]MBX9471054.1 DUF2510 domain-containing protein [Microcella sp.]